jgi:oligopeptidase A
MIHMQNPLLSGRFRIPFNEIRAEHVQPGVAQALAEAQESVDSISADESPPNWENTISRLEDVGNVFTERISPASHLVSVAETPELREAFNAVLPEISAFWSRLPLNEALWNRVKAYAESEEATGLTGLKRRHLDKTLQEFRRAGADLEVSAKEELEALKVELAQLEQKFSENVLDATASYEFHVADENRLAGVPEAARRRAKQKAAQEGLDGCLLTLDYPSVEPILKYCEDRALRKKIHAAFATRCRDGEFDNRPLLARILRVRDRVAKVLGYACFPDYVLEERMAGTAARAIEFERDLVRRTTPYWEHDVAQLRSFAQELGLDDLEPWDAAFAMERLRKQRYEIDDEALRPYFPLSQVLEGMFEIVRRTFGVRVQERVIPEVWHPDVRYFEIYDDEDVMLGAFYTDWFPRKEKRQGAWMNNFVTGGPRADGFAPHLGVMCGNFAPPDDDCPALLTHREVETTFHEFGHLLHHCISRVEIPSRAGIHVAWDWVELPSQLMENWCWEREALDLFARHHESGAQLPDELFQRMVAARRFMGGWAQMRQISFGTVDLALHGELAPTLPATSDIAHPDTGDVAVGDQVMAFAEDRFRAFAAAPRFADLHGLTAFTHIFAGGYASGYYSYLWSEVLDADVFTRFQAEGIFNADTGRSYVDSILSRGDSEDPEVLFREFMGRGPDPEALLSRNLGPAPE